MLLLLLGHDELLVVDDGDGGSLSGKASHLVAPSARRAAGAAASVLADCGLRERCAALVGSCVRTGPRDSNSVAALGEEALLLRCADDGDLAAGQMRLGDEPMRQVADARYLERRQIRKGCGGRGRPVGGRGRRRGRCGAHRAVGPHPQRLLKAEAGLASFVPFAFFGLKKAVCEGREGGGEAWRGCGCGASSNSCRTLSGLVVRGVVAHFHPKKKINLTTMLVLAFWKLRGYCSGKSGKSTRLNF